MPSHKPIHPFQRLLDVIDAGRVGAADVAFACGLSEEQVGNVWTDIRAKRKAARYLHLPPQLSGDFSQSQT